MFKTFWGVAGVAAACLTLPGSIELLVLSIAALLPARRRVACRTPPSSWRVAVVVPAHNEEGGIAACVQSLRCAAEVCAADIFVIADNCTDATGSTAMRAGATTVLTRTNDLERGKGHALHFAFQALEPLDYDCVLVVDADTDVAPNFIAAAAGAMRDGAEAVQARYLVRNLEDSTRTRLMGLALRAFNVVRPLGRENLGLSAGILGNGFGLRTETLKAVPYLAASVVEDLEYHLSLVRSGRRVSFIDETTVYGEMPVRGDGVETQRSRWEGGRLRMLLEKSPGLALSVLRGRFSMLEPLLELLLLPLAFHVALLAAAISAPVPAARYTGLAGAAIVLLHLVAAIAVGGGGWRDLGALATAPLYVLWKIMLIPTLLKNARSTNAWVRTHRNAELSDEDEGHS
ncbi:MAG: glycosyltransferase [Acidobacteria bacterium]|nr:glycosyltransferase [Acidobacteriota bacterium]